MGAGPCWSTPGLVNGDQAFRVNIELTFELGLAPLHNVGPILLGRMRRLFLRVIAWRATDRAVANRRALFCERLSQFLDRDLGRFFDEFEDRVLMSLDPVST
jgi:hypothetical protein